MNNYAIVIGIKGVLLKESEKDYLIKFKPIGVILFKRNISNKTQVIALIKDIKTILGSNSIIMVDQEGGKVSRLNEKIWPNYPPANYFGKIALKDLKTAKKETFNNYYSIGKELYKLGFSYNCAPVLDLSIKNSNNVIGSRSFSSNPKIVRLLGYEACKGLIKAKIKPVIKHIPGHGRSKDDSHKKLPEINLSFSELKDDFFPFKKLNNIHSAMTAHIKYKKLDNYNSATHSKIIIGEIIRNKLGFKGILFSDDICMKALKGSYFARAKKAINAGCDIILHCQPNLKYIIKSTLGAGKISKELEKKLIK
ncbi:MAG: Beta-hexosaminidase [Alphaproteobacteria bacterium MarineAlpha9_Bin4]|nr:beta-N-acetylhexosaminidase [Pelagibacterales bacterium]PPR26571.1 MAG: Beta-hexosaminidase [Alphaproteobacteria bacterium MarineAlpha9_Bin4]|tara:strand:- start:1145 stop:2071 length:927 start_codon:yes stop_codon:yes gene_type:complete